MRSCVINKESRIPVWSSAPRELEYAVGISRKCILAKLPSENYVAVSIIFLEFGYRSVAQQHVRCSWVWKELEAALSCAHDMVSWICELVNSPCLLFGEVDVDD